MAKQSIEFKKTSPFSGKENTMTLMLDTADLEKWLKGELIQNAMPYLTPDEREFLMTGITPDEWGQMFGRKAGKE